MCSRITTNRFQVETVKEFKEKIGSYVVDKNYVDDYIDEDRCLCQIDLHESIEQNGLSYTLINGDPTDLYIND